MNVGVLNSLGSMPLRVEDTCLRRAAHSRSKAPSTTQENAFKSEVRLWWERQLVEFNLSFNSNPAGQKQRLSFLHAGERTDPDCSLLADLSRLENDPIYTQNYER